MHIKKKHYREKLGVLTRN